MKPKILLSLFTIFAIQFVSISQSITGIVADESDTPLQFVNVILNTAEDALFKTTVTNEGGEFNLSNIPVGEYKLYLSLVGYTPLNQVISLTEEGVNLGKLNMSNSSEEIEDATVVGKIPLIEVEPDRTVFNVSQNLSSSGNSALEVLRMAPGVQIDNDNNIIVEGKMGVIVYIDDRQSYLSGEELEAFLLSLQADEIEKIEVITQPSSYRNRV